MWQNKWRLPRGQLQKQEERDYLETVIVAGEVPKEYAARMEELNEKYYLPLMIRGYKSIRESDNCGECMAKQNFLCICP